LDEYGCSSVLVISPSGAQVVVFIYAMVLDLKPVARTAAAAEHTGLAAEHTGFRFHSPARTMSLEDTIMTGW